jgi:hypothetical protein
MKGSGGGESDEAYPLRYIEEFVSDLNEVPVKTSNGSTQNHFSPPRSVPDLFLVQREFSLFDHHGWSKKL